MSQKSKKEMVKGVAMSGRSWAISASRHHEVDFLKAAGREEQKSPSCFR